MRPVSRPASEHENAAASRPWELGFCLAPVSGSCHWLSPHCLFGGSVHMSVFDPALPRHDWTLAEIEALFELPFNELVFRAASVHRRWFDPSEVQISQLLSVKTGGCPENCCYCSQSQH